MDRLGVINRALMKTGLPLAASENDCDWNAASIFEDVACELLRSHPWGFATRGATLSREAEPGQGYNYSYKLPDDCLRAIDVRSQHDSRAPKGRFAIEGRRLLTNLYPANVRYVKKILDPGEWPLDFANAVAARLAVEIAALSAESMNIVPQLTQLAQVAYAQAQLSDARESTERVRLPEQLTREGRGE